MKTQPILSRQSFDEQMARIFDVFGPKAFSRERIKLIWRAVQEMNGQQLEHIATHMISNFRSAPLPKDFYDAVRAERNLNPVAGAGPALEEDNCEWCLDCGICEAKNKQTEKVYFIRCTCDDKGKKSYRPEMPVWKEAMAQRFLRKKIIGADWEPEKFDPEKIMGSLEKRMNEWKAKIKISKTFWEAEGVW